MVGTCVFIKPGKNVNQNELNLDSSDAALINADDVESSPLNQNGVILRRRRSRPEKSGYEFFKSFYLLSIFILCFFASLFLTLIVKEGLFNLRSSEVSKVSDSSGTSVLVYDGKEKVITWPDPPPHDDLAARARYVMHISEWGSLATNSTHEGIGGYPFVNIFAVSDGPYKNSTGVPYFYLTPLELSVHDMEANNKVSLAFTEAQSNYCNKKSFDPEDPRCAHIIFTGTMVKIPKGSEEEQFARLSLFSRHEEMKDWPAEHDWFFAKMEIIHIYLLDFFGGAAVISPDNYFATNPFQ